MATDARDAPLPPLGRAQSLAWAAVLAGVACLLQLMIPFIFDADTAYHLAVARLIRAHGVLHAFPWTSFSWLSDHYADKELAFHFLLAPLASLDPLTASRIAGAVLGGAVLVSIYAVLRLCRASQPELWSLAVLTSSSMFLVRFCMVRPHLLSLLLALWLTWAGARRRRALVFLACLAYPFCYVAWHLGLLLVIAAEVALAASGQGFRWRMPAWASLGLALGVAVHPNFPELLSLFWTQNVEILVRTAWANQPGFELGGEFLPFGAFAALQNLLWPTLCAAMAVWVSWRHRREEPTLAVFTSAAVMFLALTARSQRFVEYAVPFCVLAGAMAAPRLRWKALGPAVTLASLVWMGTVGRQPVAWLASRGEDIPASVGAEWRALIPEGAQVFTCDWGLTGELMLELPERRFMVALDPVFFWKKDPRRYRLWYDAVRSSPPNPGDLLRSEFGATYVLCDDRREWSAFVRQLELDPTVRKRLTGGWLLGAL